MPSKQRQQQRAQRASVSQQFGALSLDNGPLPPTAHLAPPEDFSAFGGSSAGSSVVGTPQPRSESPDLALLGTSLPAPPPPPEPAPQHSGDSPSIPSTLGQKTFNGTAEMPEWMANVTGGFAKEISVLMQDMDELRKEKQRLQMDVANLMRTLSEYTPGGQFGPAQWPPHPHGTIPPDHPATLPPEPLDPNPPADVDVQQLMPRGPVKPGWRTVKPEPKKIQSRVVPAPHQLPAIQASQRSNSNTSLNSMASAQPPPPPIAIPYQHAQRALPAPALPSVPSTPAHMVHPHSQPQIPQHPVGHYPLPPQAAAPMKVPSWTSWRPGNRSVPLRAPVPQPPPTIPTLFGE